MEGKQFEIECPVLPLEVLMQIFIYLSGKEIIKCRRVCKHWKTAVDLLGEGSWQYLCIRDFKIIYEDARRKSSLSHESLYKSLALWPQVGSATIIKSCIMNMGDLTLASWFTFDIVNSITVGVIARRHEPTERFSPTISYYNLETGELIESKTLSINGVDRISKYKENEHIVVVNFHTLYSSILYIVPKVNGKAMWDKPTIIDKYPGYIMKDVVLLIHNKQIYYLDIDNNICVMSMDELGEFSNKVICETRDQRVVPVGISYCNNTVYFVTRTRQIYSISGNKYVLEQVHLTNDFLMVSSGQLLSSTNLINNLRKFNFCINNRLLRRLCIRTQATLFDNIIGYGDIVFKYKNIERDLLYIYYAPLSDRSLDILNMEPIQTINFCHLFGVVKLNIDHIDVREIEDGHEVLITIDDRWNRYKTLGIIQFKHNVPTKI